MPSFDPTPSPRASKRRKPNPTSTPHESIESPLPFHSRILKSVKQAVYGKSTSPKIGFEFGDTEGKAEGEITPGKKEKGGNITRGRGIGGGRGDRASIGLLVDAELRRGSGKGKRVDGDGDGDVDVDECVENEQRSPSKRRRGRKGERGGDANGGEEGGDEILKGGATPLKRKRKAMGGVVEGGNFVEGDIDRGFLHTPTKNKRKKFKGYLWLDEADGLGRERELEDEGGRKEPNEISTEGGVDAGSQSGKLGMMTRHSKTGEDDTSKDETMDTPVLRQKRKQQTELNGTLNGNAIGTPAGRRRKVDRLAQKAEHMNGEAMTMSVSQQRNDHRKRHAESKPVTVEQAEEQDGASDSTDSLPRRESPDELAPESPDEGFRREKVALTRMDKQKKVRNAAPASIDQDSPFVKNSKDSALQKLSQCNAQDPLAEHAKMLQDMLEKDSEALIKLKTHILSGLTGERRLPLVNLESEHQKVYQLVEQTILAGEGNSMLIIGSRGTGKTTLVETVISELAFDHKDEFHVVRLNGFIHTDDKLALREIWRQLGREMKVENDDLNGRSNYADTLTSLLALLAHPVDEEDEDEAATARSVIFILDEFDLFASHPRQTLLYNLFDVAQSRNAPIAVLGLTTKVDVVESLEKRVKSRFGQRYVHLSLPKTFAAFQDLCLAALSYNPSTHDLLQSSKTDLHHLSKIWNAYITTLFSTLSIQHFLLTLYTISKSLPTFLTASLLPIAILSPTTLPTPTSFTPPSTLLPPESKLTLLPSLSTLSLSLLIAAARLSIILSTEITTFNMVYDEYVTLASKSKMQSSAAGQMAQGGMRVWSIGLAKGAWEGLVEEGLVVPVGGGRGGGREGLWKVDVGLEEVGGWVEGVGYGGMGVLAKWCREI